MNLSFPGDFLPRFGLGTSAQRLVQLPNGDNQAGSVGV